MPYIIDGYNLLWSIHNQGSSIDDFGLARAIDRWLEVAGARGVLVFDGIGPPDKSQFSGLHILDVWFVGQRTDADSVIEERIETSTAPKRLCVVSNDRRIRDAAKRRKARVILCDEFWSTVKIALSKKSKRTPIPGGKFFGISDAEAEYWMKEFGF